MSEQIIARNVEVLVESIEIPEEAYKKARSRYKDLAEWFGRKEAACYPYDPHIYPQGSFRLGTVVSSDEYDLDFGCRLRTGISRATHTQKQLKALVGADMEAYRQARQIQEKLEEKHRCWRLQYSDEMSFHMDGVPSIPEEAQRRQMLREAMVRAGSADVLAKNITNLAGAITDNTRQDYAIISPDWRISNSEGYALWFESRIELAMALLEGRVVTAKAAKVDDLPVQKGDSPLQQCVKVLKRHRDEIFKDDPDGKPISIIITTLAGHAYQGEQDIAGALQRVLVDMDKYLSPVKSRVPNPVNPQEDFADKWYDPKCRQHDLENKFKWWLDQAREDFLTIAKSRDAEFLAEQFQTKFGTPIQAKALSEKLGLSAVGAATKPQTFNVIEKPSKPWTRQ